MTERSENAFTVSSNNTSILDTKALRLRIHNLVWRQLKNTTD